MPNQGLLFIPDISGFTRFINETDIEHSRLIVQELLEILINANQLGLEVSEIEGDAILFYKFGDPPAMEDLYKQTETMFCAFHQSLVAYEQRRYCQCKACTSAVGLTLKIVTHYGEFTGYNVRQFNKLIGKDVIVAHQLLKNDIEQHEYWLVTKNLLPDSHPAGFAQWMKWNSSTKQTESGIIKFHYTQLSELKHRIPAQPLVGTDLSKKVKVITVSREYETDIITLFHASGDFTFRNRWMEGVKSMEDLNHFLPRVGMRSRCITEDGELIIHSSGYSYSDERIEFTETIETNKTVMRYVLEKTGEKKTKLTLDFFIEKSIISELLFKTKKKKMEGRLQQSLLNLESVIKEIKLPGAA